MSYAADPVKRAAILAAEQKRLDWLWTHPDIPVMDFGQERMYVATEAEVDAIAAATGQPREELAAGSRVIVRFGAGVSYVALATEQASAIKAVA